jgi:Photosynthesis system II assembly factor YCF48
MQHGWLTVDNGTTLYRTSDGGAHWVKITPAIAASITSVARLNFVSTEIGWALGYTPEGANTLLFKTADGGKSWTKIILTIP